MAEVIPYRFRLRGGTASEWAAANPVLLAREPGVESDTRAIKIGDGTTTWNNLPYSGRNITTVLSEADQAAASRITAEDLPALRNRVTSLETNGTGGAGTAYDDSALRTDMATADTKTLTDAKAYTDQEVYKDRQRITTLEDRPKSIVLSQSAYDGLATKDANALYFIRS